MNSLDVKTERVEGWNRPPVIETDGEGELLEVAMGPHHPSTHGVFRMDLALDEERVAHIEEHGRWRSLKSHGVVDAS